jgi:hypothetical protein
VRIENVLPTGSYILQFANLQYLDLFENWDKNLARLAEHIARVTGRTLRPLPGSDSGSNPPGPPSRAELAYWESVKDSNDPVELEAYLRRYPDGRFASLAKRRIRALREVKKPSGPVPTIPVPTPVTSNRKWINIAIIVLVALSFVVYVLAHKGTNTESSNENDQSANEAPAKVVSNDPPAPPTQAPVAPVSTAPPAPPANAINVPRCATAPECIAQMMKYTDTDQAEALGATAVSLTRFAPPASADADHAAARELNKQGLAALQADDTNSAVTDFANAAKSDPHDVEVVANLGYALLQARDYADAETVFERALTLAPARTNTWAPYADVLAQSNRPNDAVQALLLAYDFSGNQQHTIDIFIRKANDPSDPVLQQAYAEACRHVCPH